MMNLGDIKKGHGFFLKFTTSDADGAACSFDSTPTVSVYTDGTLIEITQSDSSITLTEDFDGVTGLHQVQINTGASAIFLAEKQYSVVVSGSVDGVSVVSVLARFSIESEYPYIYPVAITEIESAGRMLEKLQWLFARFANKHTSDNVNGIRVYQEESSPTLLSQQAVSETSGVKSVECVDEWEAE